MGLAKFLSRWADNLLREENARLRVENERLGVQNTIAVLEREQLLAVVDRNHKRIMRESADFQGPLPPNRQNEPGGLP